MGFEFGGAEARSDVLLAVPVEGLDRDEDRAFHFGGIVGICEALDKGRVLGDCDDAGVAEYLQPALVGVVQGDECDPVVTADVSGADVLQVAPKVGPADGVVVDDAQETPWAAAVLDVRPPRFAYGGEVEAVPLGEILALVVGERVDPGSGVALHAFAAVEAVAAILALHADDGIGERDGAVVLAHRCLPSRTWT